MSHEETFERVCAAREAAWGKIGEVDPYVLSHLVNPTFMGGPRWPAMRQAFRIVRRNGGVIVASEGLSDPSDQPGGSPRGFGLEVYAESRDAMPGELKASWLFQMVWQVAQLAAGRGGFDDLLDDLGTISTELYDVSDAPAAFVNEHERIGIILNLVDDASMPSHIELPTGKIRLVNAKLLQLPELNIIAERGDAARADIARKLAAQGNPLLSSVHRASVV